MKKYGKRTTSTNPLQFPDEIFLQNSLNNENQTLFRNSSMFMTEVLHERTPNEMNIINNSNITELANKNTKKRKNKTKNEIPDGSDPISRLSPVDLNNLISSLSSQCMRPASLDKVLIGSNCYQHGQMLESLGFQERLDGDGYYLKLDKANKLKNKLINYRDSNPVTIINNNISRNNNTSNRIINDEVSNINNIIKRSNSLDHYELPSEYSTRTISNNLAKSNFKKIRGDLNSLSVDIIDDYQEGTDNQQPSTGSSVHSQRRLAVISPYTLQLTNQMENFSIRSPTSFNLNSNSTNFEPIQENNFISNRSNVTSTEVDEVTHIKNISMRNKRDRFTKDDDLISDASTESDHMFGPDLLSPKPKLVSEGSILIKTPPFTFTGDHLSPIRQFQNENMYEHRRPSTIESFHSKFEMESFQYNDSRNRNNSSKSKNSLYRPSTMSYDLPSHSHLSPRTEHLCLSQNDAANIFSTPKQTSAILSGEGEYDWCNSLGACTVACAHLLKSHVPANDSHHSTYRNTIDHNDVSDNDSSNVLLTRLRRSSTISNLPPRPSIFSPIGSDVVNDCQYISIRNNDNVANTIIRKNKKLNQANEKRLRLSYRFVNKKSNTSDNSINLSTSHSRIDELNSSINSDSHLVNNISFSSEVSNESISSLSIDNIRKSQSNRRSSSSNHFDDRFCDIYTTYSSNKSMDNHVTIEKVIEQHEIFNNDSRLNKYNFSCHIIGGTYQYFFESNYPVISLLDYSKERIVGLNIHTYDQTLSLRMYCPDTNNERIVELSNSWTWMKANPVGFIIFEGPVEPNYNTVGYFSIKHLSDWNDNSIDKELNDLSIMSTSSINNSHLNKSLETSNENMIIDQVDLKAKSNFNNISIVSHILTFLFNPIAKQSNQQTSQKVSNDFINYILVNKIWAIASYSLLANHLSKYNNISKYNWNLFEKFMRKYYTGNYINEGSFKKVYKVVNPSNNSYDAVSIINITDLIDRSMDYTLSKELEIAIVCSFLKLLNVCPNYIQVHDVFHANFTAYEKLWNVNSYSTSSNDKINKANHKYTIPYCKSINLYQYMHMEFCENGDIESYIRQIKYLDIQIVQYILFQLFYCLYCSREILLLRHYDIKLSNFFVTSFKSLNNNIYKNTKSVYMNIGFGNNVYSLPFTSKDNYLVKLADFGTSVIGSEGLGDPINVEHFTTLENSPPEFYLLGSLAKQGYSADTFSLGLAVLHLFTGLEPYEELLSKVLCPEYLIKKISKIWRAGNKTNPYNVIKQVIDTLDESNNMSNRYPGIPNDVDSNKCECYKNPVFEIMMKVLYRNDILDTECHRCYNTYMNDCRLWSIANGSADVMVECRSRMLELHPNMMKLLEKMLHFDPSRRCTMHEALSSNIFDNLLSNFSDNDKRDSEINYLYYYRSKEQGGLANLPIV